MHGITGCLIIFYYPFIPVYTDENRIADSIKMIMPVKHMPINFFIIVGVY
jgi:hypothetical protein